MLSIEAPLELTDSVCRMLSFNIDFPITENIAALFWIMPKTVKLST